MSDFRKLEVWRKAHDVMIEVHAIAGAIRGGAYLSLKSQIIRAAMSIPANIVEGRAQRSERDFSRFLSYAIASTSELEYHLVAARDIGAVEGSEANPIIRRVIEVRRMLIGLRKALTESADRRSPPPGAVAPGSS